MITDFFEYGFYRKVERIILIIFLGLLIAGNSKTSEAQTIIDNNGEGYSAVGVWKNSTYSPGYYGSDYNSAESGDGSAYATWTFDILEAGRYNISAKWTSHSNRASNASYGLFINGTFIETVIVNQQTGGGSFNFFGTYDLPAGTLEVILSNKASGYVIADAVMVDYLGPSGNIIDNTDPEYTIAGSWQTSTYSPGYYGSNYNAAPAGNGSMTATWTFHLAEAGQYEISAQWTSHSNRASNAPYDLFINGIFIETVIVNQQTGGGSFNFFGTYDLPAGTLEVILSNNASGYVIADAVIVDYLGPSGNNTDNTVIDNTDPEYTIAGSWQTSTYTPGYYSSNYNSAPAGDGSTTATWSFDIAEEGKYELSAQWTAFKNRANDAPYKIYVNGIEYETIRVDQTINGGQFNLLGKYNLPVGTFDIVLSNRASNYVIADAVKLVKTGDVEPTMQILSPMNDQLLTSQDITIQALFVGFPAGWNLMFDIEPGSTKLAENCIPGAEGFRCVDFNIPAAEYTITAYVVDEFNRRQPYNDQVNFGIGEYYVAVGDSITDGTGDDVLFDDVSNDGRNSGGGYEPILNNLLTTSKGYPHTVINEGIGGDRSLDGVNLMPSILVNHPGAQKLLVLYGTNDAIANVSSGFGLKPGDGGYTGSFKDNMNKIIKTIINAGKEPILAKVPMALGPCSKCTPFSNPYTAFINQVTISKYNQVIEGLAFDNGLPVPPDLYNELPHDEYTDNLHPDGAGYDTIAKLWAEQL